MASCVVGGCCCTDLRTGCFIIGYMGLVWGLLVSGIFLLSLIVLLSPVFFVLGAFVVIAICFGSSIIRVIFVILYLVGLHQNRRQLVLSYLIYGCFFTVLSIALLITSLFSEIVILDLIFSIFDILLSIYFLVVVRSYYLTMNNPANRPIVYQQNMVPMQQHPYGQPQHPQVMPQHFAKQAA